MSEFTVIETQEQFDKVIGERIAKVKEKAESEAMAKYSDYETLKQQNASLASRVDEMTERIKAFDGLSDENKALKEKCNAFQLNDWRVKAAVKNNIPLSMTNRIQGDSEESTFADAEALAPMVSTKRTAAAMTSEPTKELSATEKALRELSRSLKGE